MMTKPKLNYRQARQVKALQMQKRIPNMRYVTALELVLQQEDRDTYYEQSTSAGRRNYSRS